ncbi:nucleolar protein 7 [Carassius auratus]|uniref:Nucleolar protein 7 n=1 Tax=Carassius auratus TaxID=7957 RepID=A0A6P6NDT1_CARAU|nr:nucleolar protein 7-like [Carassius auratus]
MSELTQNQFESSDDELPEEVAFDASKSVALKSVKDALDAAKREKNQLKEKRRKRQQLFQEQKKRKLLPQELLEEFDTELQKQTYPSDNRGIKKNVSTKPSHNKKDEEQETRTMPKKTSKSLPVSYRVMRIKDESDAKSLQQRAMDFVQSRLYGTGTKRTTNAELLSLKKKRGASQGAAVEFANKKLGAYKKARITRSNKRFIRQHKLIPL